VVACQARLGVSLPVLLGIEPASGEVRVECLAGGLSLQSADA